MRNWLLASAALLFSVSHSGLAYADLITINASGAGIYITMSLTYSPTSPQGPLDQQPNTNYPANSFNVTGISGTFTDINIGIVNAQIGATVPLTFEGPRDPFPTNTLAPPNLSFIAATTTSGALSYDNLFYPGGSPQAANNWPFSGGLFDIYGLAFTLQNTNFVVDFWSDGVDSFAGPGQQYGVAVADTGQLVEGKATVVDYQFGGLSVPEPTSMLLLGTGLLGLAASRRRSVG